MLGAAGDGDAGVEEEEVERASGSTSIADALAMGGRGFVVLMCGSTLLGSLGLQRILLWSNASYTVARRPLGSISGISKTTSLTRIHGIVSVWSSM